MPRTVKDYCANLYTGTYTSEYDRLATQAIASSRTGRLSEAKQTEIETAAQKEAIKRTLIGGLDKFPEQATDIWRVVYGSHVRRKSGIDDTETIKHVISAHQSWIKSSGHAFEEAIKQLGMEALGEHGIEIILQRDLSSLITSSALDNKERDMDWLRHQTSSDVFDLYALVNRDGKRQCFGCIQSKTSIRDRVTRDREPSLLAMEEFFWSVAITLDGDFLRLQKFSHMVNGGSADYRDNGWHAMYAFSEIESNDRIYQTDLELTNFKEHAVKAADYWLTQRQWFDHKWKA